MKTVLKWGCGLVGLALIGVGVLLLTASPQLRTSGFLGFIRYQLNPKAVDLDLIETPALEHCPGAPFVAPTAGWIGVMYGDSILGASNHSGLDIFTLEGNGVTPVYAAYDGFVTRLPDWTSAVIIRHPADPLNPERQIWTYYTHMADVEGNDYIVDTIPPGAFELEVKQGALLGYQGDYNGRSPNRVSTHLHFSLVLDDGAGQFLNETGINNTLDPSPYLGMRLNSLCADRPPACRPDFSCP